ncbi:MAG: sigma-70 family RNA polymerase sigma factor [Acidimicrobiales bacterium]
MAATRLRVETSVSEVSVPDASDAELVQAGAAGDREVFAELFRRHGPAARRVARAVAGNDHDAADAAAEAFARVFDAVVSGRAPKMEFRAYLLAATRNAAIDQLRRTDRPAPVDDLVSARRDSGELAGGPVGDSAGGDPAARAPGPSERLAADESSQLVAHAFQGLPARWQSILWLTEVEGFPAREAAGVLGISPNNVSQLAVRARARLRARYLQAHVRNHAQPRCQRTVDHLGAYLAGTLAGGQRARVEDHLRGCAACRERSAEVEDLGIALRRAAPVLVGSLAWLRRGSGDQGRIVVGNSPGPPTLPAGGAGPTTAVNGFGATAAVTVDGAVGAVSTDVRVTAEATGRGALTAVSSSPTFQALASVPVSAVAPLVAVGPATRLAVRLAAAVLALVPLLGGILGSDAKVTAIATPPPPVTSVPTTTPAPPPQLPQVPAEPVVTEAAAPVLPPLPSTSPPLTTVATALGPTVDVFDPGAGTAGFYLDNPQPSGAPLVFLVVEQQGDWLQVLLPLRPNGRTGWVRRADVSLSDHTFSIVIELAAHRITAFNGGEPFLSEPVAVGTSATPTPGGLYYTKELIQPVDAAGRLDTDGPYGPWAFGLSGFSEVLFEFMGGDGVVGIHGNNDPSVLGTDVSHGCIRMSNEGITTLADTLPLGVPVEILP